MSSIRSARTKSLRRSRSRQLNEMIRVETRITKRNNNQNSHFMPSVSAGGRRKSKETRRSFRRVPFVCPHLTCLRRESSIFRRMSTSDCQLSVSSRSVCLEADCNVPFADLSDTRRSFKFTSRTRCYLTRTDPGPHAGQRSFPNEPGSRRSGRDRDTLRNRAVQSANR